MVPLIQNEGSAHYDQTKAISLLASLVIKQIGSGLTAAAFCKEQQIIRDRFYHWRRRIQKQEPGKAHLGAFLELLPYEKKSSAGVHIRLGNGLSIEVGRGFDLVTLRAIIQTICHEETSPCLP